MDTDRRPQLPALSYLDVENQDRKVGPPTTTASPTYSSYPTGPPPPYSHPVPPSGNGWAPMTSSTHTPSESRRTSAEEKEAIRQTARQSLPSISEALGVDSHTSYQRPLPSQLQQPTSPAPASPIPAVRRSYATEFSASHHHYATPASHQFSSFRQDSAGPQTYPPQDHSKTAYAPPAESRPPLHVQTPQPAPQSQPPSHAHPSATAYHDQSASSASSNSMPPPPSNFGYGYASSTPKYAQANPPPGQNVGPLYSPSVRNGPPQTPPTSWRAENSSSSYSTDDRPAAIYGDSVKRHIDLYDLESALSDIERSSGSLADFARRYGNLMHQQARTGPNLATLPSVVELDDMMQKSRMQHESLTKIREVVLAQQAAYEQQAADQRQQSKAFADSQAMSAGSSIDDDAKAGFAGGDTKKRRGRAAPPGRCHSCNRAETPEWRRGPDGARTLCNACGLHWAKLSRKSQSGGSKTPTVGSSNLRPKEQ